ncbi:MAG: hypothetical protein ACXVR0_01835 [Solirubrobacteraceae bacterium]
MRSVRSCMVGATLGLVALWAPTIAQAQLSTRNITPLPSSTAIVSAAWTTARHDPPSRQRGDILPTVWADDDDQYTMMDDGGTDLPPSGGLWRQSMARITGAPSHIRIAHVGDPNKPPPHTFGQIHRNPKLWAGPLGPYYSSGLVAANHVFYATQEVDWRWGSNALFAGLQGIAYSRDRGRTWQFANKPFPAPLGNLSWVIRGKGGFYADGYVYAIATEREFNADTLIIGRSRPDVADMTDPSRWHWLSGWTDRDGVNWPAHPDPDTMHWPVFSSSFEHAESILSWTGHLTYPQMAYDAPLHRYLLTFTYSYAKAPPGVWRNGSELVILEAPHPWGPFRFVAHESNFGPSNGYDPGFPIKWISRDGHNLWMKWAANFNGCAAGLDCDGKYGFNYRRLHLTLGPG